MPTKERHLELLNDRVNKLHNANHFTISNNVFDKHTESYKLVKEIDDLRYLAGTIYFMDAYKLWSSRVDDLYRWAFGFYD